MMENKKKLGALVSDIVGYQFIDFIRKRNRE